MKNICITFLFAVLLAVSLNAQPKKPVDSFRMAPLLSLKAVDSSHAYIRYDQNFLHIASDSSLMDAFFQKWHRVVTSGQDNMSIVHIGGSHVQAGTLPNTIRRRILSAYPDLVADRGMIFPYSAAAKCNNPIDYKVHCPQKMVLTRNVYKNPEQDLGLCGIAVTASDSTATIDIVLSDPGIDYATSRIVILGESPHGVVPKISFSGREVAPSYVDAPTRRFVFNLSEEVDSFRIILPCQEGETFTLTGISLGNRRTGFTYHSIGVNGAAVPDYIKCPYFVRDLRLIRPDMVIFGIGINDANGPNFDSAVFHRNYLRLIDSIRTVNPHCAFVFITNNDCFKRVKKRTYAVNNNGPLVREVFYKLAEETHGAVWDQFEVMGGLKSMDKWRLDKLAQTDRIHFSRAGYELIGNLFANALFKSVNDYAAKAALRPAGEVNSVEMQVLPKTSKYKKQDSNERSVYLSY